MPLSHKKCIPCEGGTPHLKSKDLSFFFEQLEPGWKIVEEKYLEKEYRFPDFKQGLQFTNTIGNLAEQEGHHPDIHLAWGKVNIQIWTHKAHGLTENDFILAAKCDEAFSHFPQNTKF
jgi:4a-hydroxytetrahydrobiopterin dehydratase